MAATPQHGKHGAVYRVRPSSVAGDLTAEACTESGAVAQITDASKRVLDPNNPPVFTDAGGETVLAINYTNGTAYFTGNVGVVTVTGTSCYFPTAQITKVGYVTDWSFTTNLDMADVSHMGEEWKESIVGQAGGEGSVSSFFLGDQGFTEGMASSSKFFLELFTYDPDQDQTGDHFRVWCIFNGDRLVFRYNGT